MSFEHPYVLHFLWIVPVIGIVLAIDVRRRKLALARFADEELLQRLRGPVVKSLLFVRISLLLAGLTLLIFALAGPRWGMHYQNVSRKGVDIMAAIDVSPSMLVEDVSPNRLERAKREVIDLIRVLSGDRVGVVAFSGAAFIQCPLTLDYGALEMFLGQLDTGLIPLAGTDVGGAIDASLAGFDTRLKTDKVIILITDGEDNEGKALEAAQRARDMGIRIFIFGIGDPSGEPIPNVDGGFKKDADGNIIVSRLDEDGLREIADNTGGLYVRALTGDLDLDILYFDGIKSRTQATELKSGKIKVYEERFYIFIVPAFIMLLMEGMIRQRRSQGKP